MRKATTADTRIAR